MWTLPWLGSSHEHLQLQMAGKHQEHGPRSGPVRSHAKPEDGPRKNNNQNIITNSVTSTLNKLKETSNNTSKNHTKKDLNLPNEFSHINTLQDELDIDQRCFVKMKVSGMKIKTLVDTGAQVNTITTKTLFKLRAENRRKIPIKLEPSPYSNMIGASKTNISVKGMVKLDVTVGNKTTYLPFHVLDDCSVDIILGLQGLQDLGAEINLRTMKLRFGANVYTLGIKSKNEIRNKKKISLIPGKSITILVKPDCAHTSDNILIEPTPEYEKIVLSTLTKPDLENKVPVTLLNTGKKVITINRNRVIAKATAQTEEQLKSCPAYNLQFSERKQTKTTINAMQPKAEKKASIYDNLDLQNDQSEPQLNTVGPNMPDMEKILQSEDPAKAVEELPREQVMNFINKNINFEKSVLNEKQKEKFKNFLCDEVRLVMYWGFPMKSNLGPFELPLEENIPPFFIKNYKMSLREIEEMKKLVKSYVKAGICEKSSSKVYRNPVLIVQKPGSTPQKPRYRIAFDLRMANKHVKRVFSSFYRHSHIFALMNKHGCKVKSILDINDCFPSLPIVEHQRDVFSFETGPGDVWRLCTTPVGCSASPQILASALKKLLQKYEPFALSFFDDIIIFNDDTETALKLLMDVLRELHNVKLKVNLHKMSICSTEGVFLSHMLKGNKNFICHKHKDVIRKLAAPTNNKEARKLRGLISYFRDRIPNFNSITYNISKTGRMRKQFIWTEECTKELEGIKKLLLSDLCLQNPMPGKQYYLYTDACGKQMGSVLKQLDEEGKMMPVYYVSSKFSDGESLLPINLKEVISISRTLQTTRHLTYGEQVHCYTDSAVTAAIYNGKRQVTDTRIARILEFLQNQGITMEHLPGHKNDHADAISRCPSAALAPNFEGSDPALEDTRSIFRQLYIDNKKLEEQEIEEYRRLKEERKQARKKASEERRKLRSVQKQQHKERAQMMLKTEVDINCVISEIMQSPAEYKTCDTCYYGCTCMKNHKGCCPDHIEEIEPVKQVATISMTEEDSDESRTTEIEALKNCRDSLLRMNRLLALIKEPNARIPQKSGFTQDMVNHQEISSLQREESCKLNEENTETTKKEHGIPTSTEEMVIEKEEENLPDVENLEDNPLAVIEEATARLVQQHILTKEMLNKEEGTSSTTKENSHHGEVKHGETTFSHGGSENRTAIDQVDTAYVHSKTEQPKCMVTTRASATKRSKKNTRLNYRVLSRTGERKQKVDDHTKEYRQKVLNDKITAKRASKDKVLASRRAIRKPVTKKSKTKVRKEVVYPQPNDEKDEEWIDAEPLSKVLRNGKFVLPEKPVTSIEEDVKVEETVPDPEEYKLYYVPKKKLFEADEAEITLPNHATANPKVIDEIKRKLDDNFTTELTAEQIALLQSMDPKLSKIKAYIQSGKSFKSKREMRSIALKATSFAVISNLLFFLPFDAEKPKTLLSKPLLCIPERLMPWIVTQLHSETTSAIHSSPNALYIQFKQHFWRPNAFTMIKSIVKACQICQQASKRNDNYYDIKQKHQIRRTKPLEKWYLDFTNMPQQGKYVGFIIGKDAGSGMIATAKCTSFTTKVAINFVQDHILNVYGPCKEIICDNAAAFHAQEMTEFLKKNNIKPGFTTKWNPHANLSELGNRDIKTALKKLTAQLNKPWTELLATCTSAMNFRPNRITEKSPYEVLYSFPPHNMIESKLPFIENLLPEGSEEERRKLLKDVTELLTEEQEIKHDQKRADSLKSLPLFSPGDLCFALTLNHRLSLPSSRKFKFYYTPVRIVSVLSSQHSLIQELDDNSKVRKVHHSQLRKMHQITDEKKGKSKSKQTQLNILKSQKNCSKSTRRLEKRVRKTWNKIRSSRLLSIYNKQEDHNAEDNYNEDLNSLFKQQ